MPQSFTHFGTLFSLVLASCHGVLSHGSSSQDIRSLERTWHMAHKRALDGFYVIDQQEGSEWGCTEEKIKGIDNSIKDAQALAFMASTVLAENEAEFSDAYLFWFGETNAKASTRSAIKRLHYDPVNDIVKAAGSRNRVADMLMDNLSPTGLTYMCAAGDSDICAGGMAAAAHQHGAGGLSGHSIVFCDRFFTANSQQDMLRKWQNTRTLSASSGFWLLHEVQHLSAIVSDSARCIDVPDPNRSDGSGCYDPGCCSTLKDSDKIRNAQNMAFFALEVMADPERGAAPGQSCTIMKRDSHNVFSRGQYNDMAESHYDLRNELESLLRRQAKSSSARQSLSRTNNTMSSVPRARSTLSTSSGSRRPSNPASSSGPKRQATSSSAPKDTTSGPSRPRPTNSGPRFTTLPPVSVSSASGASFSMAYSTASTRDSNGVPIVPIVPVPIPVAPVAPVPPVVPPGGGGNGGGNGGDKGNENKDPKSGQPSSPPSSPAPSRTSTPTSLPVSLSESSAAPCSSRPPLAVPSGGGASPDRDGFPQAVYDQLAAEAKSTKVAPSSTFRTSTSSLKTIVPSATPSAVVNPVACYNFDINAYGYCCPGPGNPCEKDIGKCYFNGQGVSGGSSGVVPDGARCPPPEGAEYCRGPCEE